MKTNQIHLRRTGSKDPQFRSLVKRLDQELSFLDGDDHAFYDQFNKLDNINHVVLLFSAEEAISCGAIKQYEPGTVEVKRMFTDSHFRGKGYAAMVLKELENWARELGYYKCILETGIKQSSAVKLYTNSGYKRILNYGQYSDVEESLCFEKLL